MRWFRECNLKEGGRFQSRFTGEETRKFCRNFMHRENLNLYALAYSGLKLRDITSYMNRITHFDEACLLTLEKNCTEYFTCSSLFLGHVTLSMWTVGFVFPTILQFYLKSLELVLESTPCKEGRQSIRD